MQASTRADALSELWLKASRPARLPQPCNSSLFGDARRTLCSSFCKPIKAANHCKWCKCKACAWCGDTPSKGTADAARLVPSRLSSLPKGAPFAAAITSVFLPHFAASFAAGYPVNLLLRPRRTAVPRDESARAYRSELEQLVTRVYYDGKGVPPPLPSVEWFNLDVGKALPACCTLTCTLCVAS